MGKNTTDSFRDYEKVRNLNEIILSSIEEWVRVVDRDYNVKFANKALQEEFGDLTGKKCYEFWDGTVPCKECVSEIVRQEGSSRQREVEWQKG